MSKEFTPWFSPKIEPVRKGEYSTTCLVVGCDRNHYWNGKRWFASPTEKVPVIALPWRGFVEPQE